jgi:pyruvate kinase
MKLSTFKKMRKNGMDIARINTKYGNISQWEKIIGNCRKVNCEIMIDIKSKEPIPWIIKIKPDYLAISYAEKERELKEIEKTIDNNIKIISKIESKKGIENFKNIINASWGIMVARGDLSKNLSFEKVPAAQNLIVKKTLQQKKFVIVATEMLLSMVKSKKPTNAEASDIFFSVLNGADATMLSEETAIGKYPSLAVDTMRRIIIEAEKN